MLGPKLPSSTWGVGGCLVPAEVKVAQSCPTLWPDPMGFRQKYWSELPFPSSRDLPDPGIKPASPVSPALQAVSLPVEPSGIMLKKSKILLCISLEEKRGSCFTATVLFFHGYSFVSAFPSFSFSQLFKSSLWYSGNIQEAELFFLQARNGRCKNKFAPGGSCLISKILFRKIVLEIGNFLGVSFGNNNADICWKVEILWVKSECIQNWGYSN